MKHFSIPMALVDYIPVVLFLFGAVKLQRALYNKMSKGAFALFSAGSINVFIAGFSKATYKLLYAAGVCDFEVLNSLMFPTQALGFLLCGIALIAMWYHPQGALYEVAAPVLFKGTMIFVSMMCLGLGAMDFILVKLSRKLKQNGAVICFIVSFLLSLCMGYLSSKDFTQSYMNWIAQLINIVGQSAFLYGAVLLKKSGLGELRL